jgi:hypothetical protein
VTRLHRDPQTGAYRPIELPCQLILRDARKGTLPGNEDRFSATAWRRYAPARIARARQAPHR